MPMTIDCVAAALRADRPLAGEAYSDSMLPGFRREPETLRVGMPWREAAVLVLCYPNEGRVHFALMQRPSGDGIHAGQICLPGGSRDPGESLLSCALRETEEELGVPPLDVRILRELTSLEVEPSRFIVHPFVGIARTRPCFRPNPDEVAGMYEPPLEELLDAKARRSDIAMYKGHSYTVPYFRLGGQRVWGLTAMVLAELEAMLEREVKTAQASPRRD